MWYYHHLIKEESKSDTKRFLTLLTESSIKFACPTCGRAYNRRANLRQHIKYECGQQPRFKCPYCKYRSKKTSNVYTHIRSVHSDIIQLDDFRMMPLKHQTSSTKCKKRFSCPRCGSTFNRKNNLGTHVKYECGQLPRFGCPYCQYCSKKSSNIRAHVPRKHFGRKIYVIDVSTNLNQNGYTCVSGLSYQVYANLPSTRTFLLESHSSISTGMPMGTIPITRTGLWEKVLHRKYPCSNCKSVFTRKGGLTYHQKFECGQMPRFNCPYCNYRAKHISNARRHVRNCHPGKDVYTVDINQQQSQHHQKQSDL
ncbi:hypothetical protein HZH68_012339 [Vespula germanica]|uniref:C2H2-type domain-containing protein n=2 Tax=Vespula TaxID=7451 RepID=A0A834MX53_VESGE|nr:hypothetical protein HZH68_012339 [Vespula germanica]